MSGPREAQGKSPDEEARGAYQGNTGAVCLDPHLKTNQLEGENVVGPAGTLRAQAGYLMLLRDYPCLGESRPLGRGDV